MGILFLPNVARCVENCQAATLPAETPGKTGSPAIAPVWHGLVEKLARDGLSGPAVDALLSKLPATPTPSPMGRKIKELYRRKFMSSDKARVWRKYYKGVLTQANAEKCRQFIRQNAAAFDNAYARYGVPPQTAAALLFVETRLGAVLGDVPENAFYTLASMATTVKPDDLGEWLKQLPNYQSHLPWIEETMHKRAAWAYNEFRALLRHIIRDHIPPSRLPGSIYGAVGLCQFMPSNIDAYGADGDGDGFVDLFNIPDAIASLSHYLVKHGWKRDQSRQMEHKLLMTYNHSTTYANTIMALAELISDPDREPPSETPRGSAKRGRKK